VTGFAADQRPDITFVGVNNDGGGIFSLLPQAAAQNEASFDRLFGTPHGINLGRLAWTYGVSHEEVKDANRLAEALQEAPAGVRLLEVQTDRRANAELHAQLRVAARDAVDALLA
jgi:2-succinyl-5-enolpyruvyl-6-hydroxy-3-cyclohexene-1-carboxylate synthase